MRSGKRDALQYSDSIDADAYADTGEDGAAVKDLIEDEGAALAFMGVDYTDFMEYCRGIIGAALEELPQQQAAFLRDHYMRGRTLEQSAISAGYADADAGRRSGNRALHKLACGAYSQELTECLEAFKDYAAYYYAADVGNFTRYQQSGISSTEAAALVK